MSEWISTNKIYLMGGILALTVFLSALILEGMYGMPQLVFPPAPIPNHVRRRVATVPVEQVVQTEPPNVTAGETAASDEERIRKLLAGAERFFDGGNVDGARELYAAVLELDPENISALSGVGAADFMLGRFSDAERAFSQLLRHDIPDRALIRLALGAAKRRQGHFGPALGDVMIALAGRPEDPAVHMELAALYGVLGAPGRAVSHFERAYRLAGTDILSHISDPHLDPIRSNEIFRSILQQARARAAEEKAVQEKKTGQENGADADGTGMTHEDTSPE